MKDNFKIDYGLLYYGFLDEIKKITLKHDEVRSLIIKRYQNASINFVLKNKIETQDNYNFASFNPSCNCSDLEYCKRIHKMSDEIRILYNQINEEESHKRIYFNECTIKEQRDR